MATSASSIGAVSVDIIADQSKLNAGIQSAVGTAKAGGEQISAAMNSAAIKTATLQLSVDQLTRKFGELAAAGVRTAAQQAQMEDTSRRLAIAQDRLALSYQHVGEAAEVSGRQAVSAFIRVGEGTGALRAVETFLSETLKLGPALQSIFPIVGAVALGEIISKLGKELYEFYQRAINYSRDFQLASNELTGELRLQNQEIQLGNDKLEEQIGKLTGHPTNGLKEILDEDILLAEKLSKTLDGDLDKIDELLKKQSVGAFSGLFTGRMATTTNEKQFSDADAQAKLQIDRITRTQDAMIAAAKTTAESATSAADKKRALDEADQARALARNQIQVVFKGLVDQTVNAIQAAEAAQRNAPRSNVVTSGFGASQATTTEGPSRAALLQQANTRLEALRDTEAVVLSTYQEAGLKQTKTIAEQGKQAAEAAKKAATEWLSAQKDLLEDTKLNHATSAAEETEFWSVRLPEAQRKYPSVVRSIQQELVSARQKSFEELKKANAEDLKEFEKFIKDVRATAEETGKSPNVAEIQTRQATVAKPTDFGLRPDVAKDVAAPIPELQVKAAHDALESLKVQVKEIDQAWQGVGEHSAAEEKENAASWLFFLENMRAAIPGIGALIDEWGAKFNSAAKRLEAEQKHLSEGLAVVNVKGNEQNDSAALDQQKLTLQQQYAASVTHTAQDALNLAKQIDDVETRRLAAKLTAAQINFQDALDEVTTEKDLLKVAEDRLKVDAARNALILQQSKSAGELSQKQTEGTLQVQIQRGLMQDIEAAGNQFASAFSRAVVQGKGLGTVFRDALKGLETGALDTVLKNAFSHAIDAVKPLLGNLLGSLSGVLGGVLGKIGGALGGLLGGIGNTGQAATQTANTAALAGNTGAVAANTAAIVAAQATHAAVFGLNTTATTANTVATTANSGTQGVSGGIGAAGSAVSAGASAASGAATSLISGIAPIIGGAIGGVISGIFSLIGDAKIVAAIHETTAAVEALRLNGLGNANNNALPGANASTANGTPAAPQPSGGGFSALGVLGGIGSFLGFNTFSSNPTPVDVVKISPFASLGGSILGGLAGLLGFEGGGRPTPGVPIKVGEGGTEIFWPDQAGTVIPANQTAQLLASITGGGNVSLPIPAAPESAFASSSVGTGGDGARGVYTTNQNTGRIGDNHYNIYGAQNPRETMRQIADFEKRQTGKYGPANS